MQVFGVASDENILCEVIDNIVTKLPLTILKEKRRIYLRRIRSILSVAIILVTLTGCGAQKTQNNDSQTNNTPSETITDKEASDTKTTSSAPKNIDNNTKKDNTTTKPNKAEETDNASTNSNEVEKNANTSSTNTTNENSKEQKSYYGNWKRQRFCGKYFK